MIDYEPIEIEIIDFSDSEEILTEVIITSGDKNNTDITEEDEA